MVNSKQCLDIRVGKIEKGLELNAVLLNNVLITGPFIPLLFNKAFKTLYQAHVSCSTEKKNCIINVL